MREWGVLGSLVGAGCHLALVAACSGTAEEGGAGSGGVAGSGGAGTGAETSGSGGAPGGAGGGGSTGGLPSSGGVGGVGSGGQLTGSGGGDGTPEICRFDIEGSLSPALATVGVVEWSTDLAGLTGARVEFTLDDPAPDELNRGGGGPIDVAGELHRALLLGLKPGRSYTYRIVAQSAELECISPDQGITTGPGVAALVLRTVHHAEAQEAGFIVTTDYGSKGYVVDADGEVVWWAESPSQCTRATLDWEGQYMWMLQGNPSEGIGEVRRVSMDGTDVLGDVAGLETAHHDLTVLPGGIVATMLWSEEGGGVSELVERTPGGTVTEVARLDESTFIPIDSPTGYHANALAYHVWDDSYTVSDRGAGFVKLTREGEPIWNLAASCEESPAPACATGPTSGSHGHHLLPSGRFLFLTVEPFSTTYQFLLTEEEDTLMATEEWSYSDGVSSTYILGDVQLLPNGNRLVTYSYLGEIHELSPGDEVVQVISAASSKFGYASFRKTLYGPPDR